MKSNLFWVIWPKKKKKRKKENYKLVISEVISFAALLLGSISALLFSAFWVFLVFSLAFTCEVDIPRAITYLHFQNAVLALDSSALDIDQVENLIKFCPTKEEMETLKVIPLSLSLSYSFICLLVLPSPICCRIDNIPVLLIAQPDEITISWHYNQLKVLSLSLISMLCWTYMSLEHLLTITSFVW